MPGLGDETANQTGLSPVGETFRLSSPSVSRTCILTYHPAYRQGRGQLELRLNQHCSCQGLGSIPVKTNRQTSKMSALKKPKTQQEGNPEAHGDLLRSGDGSPALDHTGLFLSILPSQATAPFDSPLLG